MLALKLLICNRWRNGSVVGQQIQSAVGFAWPDESERGPKFRHWFAWYPVVLEDGTVAFWRSILRRKYERGMFYDLEWEYRDAEVPDPWVDEVGIA